MSSLLANIGRTLYYLLSRPDLPPLEGSKDSEDFERRASFEELLSKEELAESRANYKQPIRTPNPELRARREEAMAHPQEDPTPSGRGPNCLQFGKQVPPIQLPSIVDDSTSR